MIPYEMFFNDLKDEMESKETYLKAKEIWSHFKCKDHNEFITLYLKSDVMLFAVRSKADSFHKQ
jgi:hypothetical protein